MSLEDAVITLDDAIAAVRERGDMPFTLGELEAVRATLDRERADSSRADTGGGLDADDVRALLDIATASMDFGSGFLDHAEVLTLRRAAVQLGVDPITCTPSNFTTQFAHDYRPVMRATWTPWTPWDQNLPRKRLPDMEVCEVCRLDAANPIHQGVDNLAASDEDD